MPTRRDVLTLAATSLFARRALGQASPAPASSVPRDLTLELIASAPGRVVALDDADVSSLRLERAWNGRRCFSEVRNHGKTSVRLREVVLFEIRHALPLATRLYGEGFQMLSQTGGTLGAPLDLGDYTDRKHYKMPEPADARVTHGLLTLTPPGSASRLLAFSSCRRFDGQFRLRDGEIQAVVDTEGLEVAPGASLALEEFLFEDGPDREGLLARLAERLGQNHPPLAFPAPPAGWCSWYCFGPRVTARQVLDNLEVIAKQAPGLKYVQIDDGYQPAMGDWLETGPAFGGGIREVLAEIRKRGFEPAIWVAPFVAEAESRLFREHPDWFMTDATRRPLRADQVSFGGWRRGPWYALDGSHPEVPRHLEQVFRTMREEWGCSYFKMDANFWGALHGGRLHDPRATRIEAYRRGMQAIRRGAGDAFLLGCNHPIWASLGLIHGSRSSNDIKRAWGRVAGTARQNLLRNWQNGRLWWNDPDAIVLSAPLADDEQRFHAAAIFATGGMLLSGDDLTTLPAARLEWLRRLLPPTGVAARFEDETLQLGFVDLKDRRVACLLNWDDAPAERTLALEGPRRVRDLLSGEDLGRQEQRLRLTLPARSGRLLLMEKA